MTAYALEVGVLGIFVLMKRGLLPRGIAPHSLAGEDQRC